MSSFVSFENTTLVLLGGALVALGSVWLIRKAFRREGIQNILSSFFWIGAVVLSLIALAEPFIESERADSLTLVAFDLSESGESEQMEQAFALLKERLGASSQEAGVLVFSADVSPYPISVGDLPSLSRLREGWQKLNLGETDIERALESALSYSPTSVVLVSDGYETHGDVSRVMERFRASGVPLHAIVPDNSAENSSFQVKQLFAPLIAPGETAVDVRVTVENSTDSERRGILEVKQDEKVLFSQRVSLNPGEQKVFTVQSDSAEKGGIQKLEAILRPEDPSFGVSSQQTYLSTAKRNKILLLSGSQQDERFLRQALEESGYEVTPQIISKSGSVQEPELAEFSLVLLNNIAAPVLPERFVTDIRPFVEGGGALVMIGGERGFGLSGYDKTPIDAVLPVMSLPPRQEQRRLNVAVQLVLDKSRSMSFGNKIEYAKEAAREVVRNLKDEDFIGVIGFDSTPFVAFPLRQLAQSRAQALSRIGTLYPIGRTNLFPAMDEAMRGLLKAQAGRKHMIVLTDGKIPDQGPHYLTLVQNMRTYGITVSTVMMGREADVQMLRQMAEFGGGAFYQTFDARSLPRIFLNDIRVTTGEQTMKESREFIVRRRERKKILTSLENFPPLRGYVETKAKPNATTELIAFAAGTSDPLLASWRFGEGRSVAFTSDVSGRWSNYWIRWERFRGFWNEIIDSLINQKDKENRDPSRFDLQFSVEEGAVEFELVHYYENSDDLVQATVIKPNGESVPIQFTKQAEGRYQANLPDALLGRYTIQPRVGDLSLTPVAKYLGGELFGEQRGRGFQISDLIAWSSQTGGRINPSREEILGSGTLRVKEEVGRWLLPLIVLFLLLSIILREVPFALFRRSQRSRSSLINS